MNRVKDFYDHYWEQRSHILDYHKLGIVPPRHTIAVRFVVDTLDDFQNVGKIQMLDVGCGEGVLGKLLSERGLSERVYIQGVDIAKAAVEAAKGYYDETNVLDLESDFAQLGDSSFDYIMCLEVIEHIFYPKKLLDACKARLNKKGFLIISTPNFAFYKNRLTVLRGAFPEDVHVVDGAEHIHYFTFNSFRSLLADTNFELIKFDGSFGIPRPAHRVLGTRRAQRLFLARPNLFGKQIVYLCRPRQ